MNLLPTDYLDYQTRLVYSDFMEERLDIDGSHQRTMAEALRTGNFRSFLVPQIFFIYLSNMGMWRRIVENNAGTRFHRVRNPEYHNDEFVFCVGKHDFYFLTKYQEQERKKECLQRIASGKIPKQDLNSFVNFYFIVRERFNEIYLLTNQELFGPFDNKLDLFKICLEKVEDTDFWNFINNNLLDNIAHQIKKSWTKKKK